MEIRIFMKIKECLQIRMKYQNFIKIVSQMTLIAMISIFRMNIIRRIKKNYNNTMYEINDYNNKDINNINNKKEFAEELNENPFIILNSKFVKNESKINSLYPKEINLN